MRVMFGFAAVMVTVLLPSIVSAQKSSQSTQIPASQSGRAFPLTMTFEVASIRQSKTDLALGITVSGGFEPPSSSHLILRNFSFRNLLAMAYPKYEVGGKVLGFSNLPGELRAAYFDVQAKADAATEDQLAKLPRAQAQLEQSHMVQVLLADRFNLKAHWEMHVGNTYNLVLSKPGKLHSAGTHPSAEERKSFRDRAMPPLYQKGDSSNGFEYIAHGATMTDVANMLAEQFGAPVIDKTGLTGKYDFDLKTYGVRSDDRLEAEVNPWPPLEAAIQDQLGLKLIPSRGPVKYLVIDHAEMPSPN